MRYNRRDDLNRKINTFLSNITEIEKDYMKIFSQEDLLDLKSVLSDINNVLTLETTLSFANWLKELYSFTDQEFEKIIEKIESTKANANGFDIIIETSDKKILAEIKCIVPVNNSNKFGAAQRNSILDDALKLINGKKSLANTKEYHKFIGIVDTGDKTDNAIRNLIEHVKSSTKDKKQINRNEVVSKIKYIDNIKLKDISSEFVYIKRIKIDDTVHQIV